MGSTASVLTEIKSSVGCASTHMPIGNTRGIGGNMGSPHNGNARIYPARYRRTTALACELFYEHGVRFSKITQRRMTIQYVKVLEIASKVAPWAE